MLSLTYLLLAFIIIFVEVTRKKSNLIDFLTYFHLHFFLFYVFPGFTISQIIGSVHGELVTLKSNFQVLIAVYLGYFLVLLGFYSKSAIKAAQRIHVKRYQDKTLLKISNYFLIFTVICVLIYSQQYGGFIKAISQSAAIRSGNVESGSLVLFKNFFDCAEYASYLLIYLAFFSREAKKTIILYLTLGLSIALTVMTILMQASRTNLINYFIGLTLAYIIYKNKIPWAFAAVFVMLSFAIILYGDPLFSSLSSIPDGYDAFITEFSQRLELQANFDNGNSLDYRHLALEFDHPIVSLDIALSNDNKLRWFVDFIYGLGNLLPERLIPIKIPLNIAKINSYLVLGHADVTIPPGFLALGIYSMSWMGLVTISLCYGWLGRCLQTVLNRDIKNQSWIAFLYVIILNMWVHLVASGDPTYTVKGNTVFVLLFVFIFYFSVKKYTYSKE